MCNNCKHNIVCRHTLDSGDYCEHYEAKEIILTNAEFMAPILQNAIRYFTTSHTKKAKDTWSITTIEKPFLQYQLSVRYNLSVIDAQKHIKSLNGTAFHMMMEKVYMNNCIRKTRLTMPVVINGKKYTISGEPDEYYLDAKYLNDYKTTGCWKWKKGDYEDYILQLSGYKMLLEHYGLEVEKASISMIFTDWKSKEAKYNSEYPPFPQMTRYFQLPDFEQIKKYFFSRLERHILYSSLDIEEIPFCEDRWTQEEHWKVKKTGAKRSSKNFYAKNGHMEIDAIKHAEYLSNSGKKHHVEHAPGCHVRCEEYCSYNIYCPYYNKEEKQ